MMKDNTYNIKTPVFEGPLDLLLSLIRDNKIDIYDIPIAFITSRYLQYLQIMEELNLNIAGDFIVMASTLVYIKSRMLLPVEEQGEDEDMEDPRTELVQQLIEYRSYKEAAFTLKEKESEWNSIFSREETPEIDFEEPENSENIYLDVSLYDLLKVFKEILDRAPPETRYVYKETFNINDKITEIREKLVTEKTFRFDVLFANCQSRRELIVTFLALLEAVKTGLVHIYQKKEFDSIWILHPESDRESIENA